MTTRKDFFKILKNEKSEEQMTVEENDGQATIEIRSDDIGNIIYNNKE